MKASWTIPLLAASILIMGAGCSQDVTGSTELELQREKNAELKQERMMIYRDECKKEWKESLDTWENFVLGHPELTPAQIQNFAQKSGVGGANGFLVDTDVWVKKCMDKKDTIFE